MTDEQHIQAMISRIQVTIKKLEAERLSFDVAKEIGKRHSSTDDPEDTMAWFFSEEVENVDEQTKIDQVTEREEVVEIDRKIASNMRRLKIYEDLAKRCRAQPKAKKDIEELKAALKTLKKMSDKIKWLIGATEVLMTATDVMEELRKLGDDIKPNMPENSDDNKKTFANISATMKIYTDREELERCRLPGSNLYYYGLPQYFKKGRPLPKHIPSFTTSQLTDDTQPD